MKFKEGNSNFGAGSGCYSLNPYNYWVEGGMQQLQQFLHNDPKIGFKDMKPRQATRSSPFYIDNLIIFVEQ